MEVIDWEHHMSPKEYAEMIKGVDDFHYHEQLNISSKYPMDVQIKDMKSVGIDMACLTGNPLWDSVKYCKLFNDEMAKWVKAHPDKFIGFACAPPIGDGGLEEIDRVVKDLGFKAYAGHISNIGFKMLDSPELYPFYKKISDLDIPIFVHVAKNPVYPFALPEPIQSGVRKYSSGVDREFDLIIATITLSTSEVLEKFPKLKFVLGHLGGGIAAMWGRIWSTEGLENQEQIKTRQRAQKNFEKLYVDTAGIRADIDTLKFALTKISPKRIVFGTDCPPGNSKEISHFVKDIKKIDISDKDKELILGGNAKEILKIK